MRGTLLILSAFIFFHPFPIFGGPEEEPTRLFERRDFQTAEELIRFYEDSIQILSTDSGLAQNHLDALFSHLSMMVQESTLKFTPQEVARVFSLSRKIESRWPAQGGASFEKFDEEKAVRGFTLLFFKALRESARSGADILVMLKADFPRAPFWTEFRRNLSFLSVDRFVEVGGSMSDVRELAGLQGAGQSQPLYLKFRERMIQSLRESPERHWRRLGRSLDAYQWESEPRVLLLSVLARQEFSSFEDLRRAYQDALQLISNVETRLDQVHIDSFLFHYWNFISAVCDPACPVDVGRDLLRLPHDLLASWEIMSRHGLTAYVEFPWNPALRFGARYSLQRELGRRFLQRLKMSKSADEFIQWARIEFYPSDDMENLGLNVAVTAMPHFFSFERAPDFRQLLNFLAVVPRTNDQVLMQLRLKYKDEPGSDLVKFIKALDEIQQSISIVTRIPTPRDESAAKPLKPGEAPPITEEEMSDLKSHHSKIILLGRLLLLQYLRSPQSLPVEESALLRKVLGNLSPRLREGAGQVSSVTTIWERLGNACRRITRGANSVRPVFK